MREEKCTITDNRGPALMVAIVGMFVQLTSIDGDEMTSVACRVDTVHVYICASTCTYMYNVMHVYV